MTFTLLVFLSESCAFIKSEEEFQLKPNNGRTFTVSRVNLDYLRPNWEWVKLKILEKYLLGRKKKI